MRLDRYMELCLGHPVHGYYRTRDPFGGGGDFVTAPEVSQMFGELIAVWCVDAWDAMGRPENLHLIELGPGRGTLMADVTRTLRAIKSFQCALQIHLVETSPVLKACQERTLASADMPLAWHDRFAQVPTGPAIILANEFFDALPVRQFEHRLGAWFERVVGTTPEGQLAMGLAPGALDIAGFGAVPASPPEGAFWEFAPARRDVATALGGRLSADGGAALIVDYGHVAPGFGDTVQAVKAHEPVAVTHRPGEADLTAHVDFAGLARVLECAGATLWPILTQGAFLRAMGIEARAEALKQNADVSAAADIDAALARLTHCDQMGNLFKVCAAGGRDMRPPYPFGETPA
jgi:SAM-dependent MidA family methyltransferase